MRLKNIKTEKGAAREGAMGLRFAQKEFRKVQLKKRRLKKIIQQDAKPSNAMSCTRFCQNCPSLQNYISLVLALAFGALKDGKVKIRLPSGVESGSCMQFVNFSVII